MESQVTWTVKTILTKINKTGLNISWFENLLQRYGNENGAVLA